MEKTQRITPSAFWCFLSYRFPVLACKSTNDLGILNVTAKKVSNCGIIDALCSLLLISNWFVFLTLRHVGFAFGGVIFRCVQGAKYFRSF